MFIPCQFSVLTPVANILTARLKETLIVLLFLFHLPLLEDAPARLESISFTLFIITATLDFKSQVSTEFLY